MDLTKAGAAAAEAAALIGCSLHAGEIHDAVLAADLDQIERLLQSDPQLATAPNRDNETPLHPAAAAGNTAILELLLSTGAGINAADQEGRNPLHVAAGSRRQESAELFVNHGADITARDKQGQTPLDLSLATGQRPLADLMKQGTKELS